MVRVFAAAVYLDTVLTVQASYFISQRHLEFWQKQLRKFLLLIEPSLSLEYHIS